jgi:hypothetical protein
MSERPDRPDEPERRAADEIARAHAALAAAQDRSYWLDRWGIDLNALMRRRGASELRTAVRALRAVYRVLDRAIDQARLSMRALPGRTAGLRRVLADERAQAAGDPATPAVGSRLTATAVSDSLRGRIDADDPRSLVAVQRADMLVEALSATGCDTLPGQRWLGLGTGADGVLAALADAFPGLERSDNGVVDVAFAISGWADSDPPLERLDELRDAVARGGRLLLTAGSGSDAQALTPERVLAHCTPDWRIALYVPGGMEGDRDLYVLERA